MTHYEPRREDGTMAFVVTITGGSGKRQMTVYAAGAMKAKRAAEDMLPPGAHVARVWRKRAVDARTAAREMRR
jgi:hypothetical protein